MTCSNSVVKYRTQRIQNGFFVTSLENKTKIKIESNLSRLVHTPRRLSIISFFTKMPPAQLDYVLVCNGPTVFNIMFIKNSPCFPFFS